MGRGESYAEFAERAARWYAAKHRRRMRWWKHAREYLSLKRLITQNLYRPVQPPDKHPPWSDPSNWTKRPAYARRY